MSTATPMDLPYGLGTDFGKLANSLWLNLEPTHAPLGAITAISVPGMPQQPTLPMHMVGGPLATLPSAMPLGHIESSASPEPVSASYVASSASASASVSPEPGSRSPRKRRRSVSAAGSASGHIKARKDDVPEHVIQRLLRTKPSKLTPEEREIRKRAKNRLSAATARMKRKAKQKAHSNRLENLQAENAQLRARVAALEAENEALRSAPLRDDHLDLDFDIVRPAKRRCA